MFKKRTNDKKIDLIKDVETIEIHQSNEPSN
jgi:hypothetical protein